jgi:hypothetical protein
MESHRAPPEFVARRNLAAADRIIAHSPGKATPSRVHVQLLNAGRHGGSCYTENAEKFVDDKEND